MISNSFAMNMLVNVLLLWLSIISVQGSFIDNEYPIVFKPPPNYQQGGLFGYSVGKFDNRADLLIGAPKLTSPKYNGKQSTGALFRCPIAQRTTASRCEEISLDPVQNLPSHFNKPNMRAAKNPLNNTYYENMSIGLTIASHKDKALVCAPNWYNQVPVAPTNPFEPPYDRFLPGRCWLIDDRLSLTNIVPFTEREKYSRIDKSGGTKNGTLLWYFAYATGGISAAMFDEPGHPQSTALMIGSPGFDHWRGGYASYTNGNYDFSGYPKRFSEKEFETDQYIGYATAVGKFGAELMVATGAPMDKSTGRVYVFLATEIDQVERILNKKLLRATLKGDRIGEYFGAVLMAGDMTGDKFDDLMVGSPLYGSRLTSGDVGRVSVYLGSKDGLLDKPSTVVVGKTNGRFGSAIAMLDDINGDQLQEVAIAAPFENNGEGAIYIYAGDKFKGIGDLIQELRPQNIRRTIRSFGSTLMTSDVDSNSIKDLIIGSFMSDEVTVLRTSPAAKFEADIEFSIPYIDTNVTCPGLNSPCFTVRITAKYTSVQNVRPSQTFKFTLEADTSYRSRTGDNTRGLFESTGTLSYDTTETLNLNKPFTKDLRFVVGKNLLDKATALVFTFSWTPIFEQSASFCKDCPKFSLPYTHTTKLIPFNNGCEGNCTSFIKLDMDVPGTVVLGETNQVTLKARVKTQRDPVFQAIFNLNYSSNYISIFQNSEFCKPSQAIDEETNSIECDLGNPLIGDTEIEITFAINPKAIGSTVLTFDGLVSTTNVHTENSTMKLSRDVQLTKKANVEINSKPGYFYYEHKQVRKESDIAFDSVINVEKSGSSSVELVQYSVKIPAEHKGHKLICLPRISERSGVDSRCTVEHSDLDLKPCPNDLSTNTNPIKDNEISVRSKKQESIPGSYLSEDIDDKDALIVNCANSRCLTINCKSGPFPAIRERRAFVTMLSALNIDAIENAFGESHETIKLVIDLQANIADDDMNENLERRNRVVITFRQKPYKGKVKLGIIIGSSIGALVLLLIIAFILYKVGFFKRKKPEDFDEDRKAAAEEETEPAIKNQEPKTEPTSTL